MRRTLHPAGLAIVVAVLLASCASSSTSEVPISAATTTGVTQTSVAPTTKAHRFTAEERADIWFSLSVNGVLVGEDSVPITTERSFNAETIEFEAAYPLVVAMVSKDYIENQSGLEYIGQPNQQIGDGGLIAQFTDDTTGRRVLVTSTAWRGLVIQTAPLNTDCEKSADPLADCLFEEIPEPGGWESDSFDATGWMTATEYTESEIGVKDGYNDVDWDPTARLIWGDNLKTQNAILWRAPIVE